MADDFGSRLHYHNDEDFTVWDAKQQEVKSACRVEPSSTQDVSNTLSILVDNWCRFAVKGGGHSQNPDDSVSVGGVTVDMHLTKSLDVAPDRKSVSLGSGHFLYTMYHGLEAFKLTTIGGRVADVGLGGYALGGGISNLSPRYGLAVDNILEYEVCVEPSQSPLAFYVSSANWSMRLFYLTRPLTKWMSTKTPIFTLHFEE